jgi:thiol-disulfide isomerase/thioredoxin
MSVETIEFADLEKALSRKHVSFRDFFASEVGKVYVVCISRDGCPVCVKQKPKVDRLAKALAGKYGGKVVFARVHVKYSPERNQESLRSKDVFGHYFYPTNLVLVRSRDKGAFEYYRAASSRVSELARNIAHAVEVAKMLEKQ